MGGKECESPASDSVRVVTTPCMEGGAMQLEKSRQVVERDKASLGTIDAREAALADC